VEEKVSKKRKKWWKIPLVIIAIILALWSAVRTEGSVRCEGTSYNREIPTFEFQSALFGNL